MTCLSLPRRQAHHSDMPHIMAALRSMAARSPAPQMKYAEEWVAEGYISHAIQEGYCHFVGNYFVLYTVGCDWYSSKPYLIELLILKVYDAGDGQDVLAAIRSLDAVAEERECQLMGSADTQIGYIAKKYEDAGWTKHGVVFYKEPTWVNSDS